ncbi:hypothetical protein D3C87_1113030 [compost metagenome]
MIDLVGNRGGDRAEARYPGQVRQFGAGLAQDFLGLPALGDVLQRGNVFQAFFRFLDRVRDQTHIFDRAIGHQQSMLMLEVTAPAALASDHFPMARYVVRVNAPINGVEARRGCRIQFKDSIDLFGPGDLVGADSPGKRTRGAQALGFGKKGLTLLERRFGTHTINGDTGQMSELRDQILLLRRKRFGLAVQYRKNARDRAAVRGNRH